MKPCINWHIGRIYIEAGYFSGAFTWGDNAIAELSLLQYVDAGREERWFSLFNIRIWRLVLAVSVDFKKEAER